MADHWETAPRHMMRLDIRSLLQDAAIEEVRSFASKAVQNDLFLTPFTLKKDLNYRKVAQII